MITYDKIKGNKSHYTRLYPKLEQCLEWMINEVSQDGYLIHWKNKPIKSMKKSFQSLLKKCDIDLPKNYNGVHVLRHTAASFLASTTKDIKLVKEILGQSKLEMTMRYIHFVNDYTPEVDETFSFLPEHDTNN